MLGFATFKDNSSEAVIDTFLGGYPKVAIITCSVKKSVEISSQIARITGIKNENRALAGFSNGSFVNALFCHLDGTLM